jgi:hypothetical protein
MANAQHLFCSTALNFEFMTPGPAPRRLGLEDSRRASRSDVAAQSKPCSTSRTAQPSGAPSPAPAIRAPGVNAAGLQVRRGAAARARGRQPGNPHASRHGAGAASRLPRHQGPALRARGGRGHGADAATPPRGEDGWPVVGRGLATSIRSGGSCQQRALLAAALPLLCPIGRWGWGSLVVPVRQGERRHGRVGQRAEGNSRCVCRLAWRGWSTVVGL